MTKTFYLQFLIALFIFYAFPSWPKNRHLNIVFGILCFTKVFDLITVFSNAA